MTEQVPPGERAAEEARIAALRAALADKVAEEGENERTERLVNEALDELAGDKRLSGEKIAMAEVDAVLQDGCESVLAGSSFDQEHARELLRKGGISNAIPGVNLAGGGVAELAVMVAEVRRLTDKVANMAVSVERAAASFERLSEVLEKMYASDTMTVTYPADRPSVTVETVKGPVLPWDDGETTAPPSMEPIRCGPRIGPGLDFIPSTDVVIPCDGTDPRIVEPGTVGEGTVAPGTVGTGNVEEPKTETETGDADE